MNIKRIVFYLYFIMHIVSCEFLEEAVDTIDDTCNIGRIDVNDASQGDTTFNFCDGSLTCAFNDAIATANLCPEPVTIYLEASTVYRFDSPNTGNGPMRTLPFWGNSALPTVSGNVIIEGNFSVLERSRGADDFFRFFHVAEGASLTLRNLTIRNGYANAGTNSLENNGNHGGAIFNEGTLTLEDCILTDNTANLRGGGIYSEESANLFISDSFILNNESVEKNAGIDGGGGGGIYTTSDTILIEQTAISFNKSRAGGGMTIGDPGGNDYGTALIKKCIFEGNTATYGGAVHNTRLAGVFNEDGTFIGNVSKETSSVFENVTFTRNTATGGAFYIFEGTVFLKHVSILYNSAEREFVTNSTLVGGGFHLEAGQTTVGAELENCIVLNGLGGDFGGTGASNVDLKGINFIGDTTVVKTSNNPGAIILTGNPGIGLLEGVGYQRGYVPFVDSQVIDAVIGSDCLAEDQRGNPRGNTNCDLGAIELQ